MEPRPIRIEELLAHAGWVRNLAACLVSDAATADDVAQEVWAQALRSPPRDRRNLRGWLRVVAESVARSMGRSASRRAARDIAAAQPGREEATADLVERGELHRQLVEQVMALEEPYRAIVLAHWFEDQSIPEIARQVGMTPRMARARLEAAHARLRSRLDAGAGGRDAWALAYMRWIAPRQAAGAAAGLGGVLVASKFLTATVLFVLLACLTVWGVWTSSNSSKASHALSPPVARADSSDAPPGAASSIDARTAMPTAIELVVHDECDRPVAGAKISARSGEAGEILGTTDELGRVRIPDRAGLEVRREGYVSAPLPATIDRSPVVVSLTSSRVISGRLSSPVPGFRPEAVTVYALAATGAEWTIDGSRIATAAGTARVAPDGTFRFPCLDPTVGYSLVAGGDGWVSQKRDADPWPFVHVGDEAPPLAMKRLYAALLQLQDQSGAPAHISATIDKSGYSAPVTINPGGRVETISAESVAAGASMEWLDLPEGTLLRMLVVEKLEQDPLPSTLQLQAPGYDDASIDYLATSVGKPLAPQPVQVHRSVDGFGTLRIRYSLDGDRPPDLDSCPMGSLRLESERGAALTYLISPIRVQLDIEGVPVGRYRVSFLPLLGSTTIPVDGATSQFTTISPGAAAEFVVPVRGFGSVRVRLETLSGTEYEGTFSYLIRPLAINPTSGRLESRGRAVQSSQFHAPFVLRGMQAGSYSLSVLAPKPRSEEHSRARGGVVFEVREGESSTLSIPVEAP